MFVPMCVRTYNACVATRTRVHARARARTSFSTKAFSIKINTGGWPRPGRPPVGPRSLLSPARTVLISPPNRRTCSMRCILSPPSHPSCSFTLTAPARRVFSLSYVHYVINWLPYCAPVCGNDPSFVLHYCDGGSLVVVCVCVLVALHASPS